MEQKGEKERSQRSRLGENARQRVHHNVLEYNFLASATNAWTPGVVDNEDNNYSAFPNIDEKKLSADNVPLILRGKLHKKELKQSEFGSMTAQETAHFMASAAIDGWSDPILPPVERTLSEYQRPSQLSMAPITRGLGASPGNLILVGRILPVIPVFLYRVYTPLPNAAATAKNALILSDADTATSSTTKLVAVSSLPHGQVILQLVKGVHKASESARVRSYISSSPAKLD